MLEKIRELLGEAMEQFSAGGGPASGWEVLPAESDSRGHFSTNAAFVYALSLSQGGAKVSPMKAAAELKEYLEEKGLNFFSKIEVAEPGFLNLWLRPEVIRGELEKIIEAGEKWGKPFDSAQGKVIVEYSQPNIAKPLQAHHLRSTIIGDAIANILEFAGYEIIRWNYLGDWGTHFGKLIAEIKKLPEEQWVPVIRDVGQSAAIYAEYREDPEVARREFKKLEEGDPENRKLWQESRDASIENLKKLYKRLGVKEFNEWTGESAYEDQLSSLVQDLQQRGIAEESKGAFIVPLEKYNLPPALIRKSDGATLYLTRDIASLEDRVKNHRADLVLYVVDNSQTLHFQQLFAIADILKLKGEFIHIKFGLLLGKDLKKLSTRTGTGIELEGVIEEAVTRARKVMEEKEVDMSEKEKDEVAEIVGIGALKYNDLSQNRVADITFDWDKMLSLQGNSAPYLQYTYARLKSVLRKFKEETGETELPPLKVEALEKEADLRLILKLAFFPEAIQAVSENYLPHQIANYLYDLARAINDYYEKEPILKADEGLRTARLHLIQSAANTLKTGLALLGIKTAERM